MRTTLLLSLLSLPLLSGCGHTLPTFHEFNRAWTKPFRVVGKVVPIKDYRAYRVIKKCTEAPFRCVVVLKGWDVDEFRIVVQPIDRDQISFLRRKKVGDIVHINLSPRSVNDGVMVEVDGKSLEVYMAEGVR